GILPTPAIGGVGLMHDVTKHATIPFKAAGETIIVIGETKGHLGQSIYLREILGREEGPPPPVDLKVERRNGDFVRTLITTGRVTAVHDASDGGLAVTIAEMAMSSGLGATLTTPQTSSRVGFWFGEDQARYVVTVKTADADKLLADAKAAGVPAAKLGMTAAENLTLDGEDPFPAQRLRKLNEEWLPKLMSAA
ncbi:MAG: AIR synthase-related protein, partial [Micropepsaceae bacterium]